MSGTTIVGISGLSIPITRSLTQHVQSRPYAEHLEKDLPAFTAIFPEEPPIEPEPGRPFYLLPGPCGGGELIPAPEPGPLPFPFPDPIPSLHYSIYSRFHSIGLNVKVSTANAPPQTVAPGTAMIKGKPKDPNAYPMSQGPV